MVKPGTGDGVTGVVHHRAFRGSWGQRAGKDSSRNLGDPAVRKRQRDQRITGIHNRDNGTGRESERPIVAEKRGNVRGAKGPQEKHVSKRKGEPWSEPQK